MEIYCHGQTVELTQEQLDLFNDLTDLQQKMSLAKLAGMSNYDAYVHSGGTAQTDNSRNASACTLLKNVNVRTFIDSFSGQRISNAVMSRDEMMRRLTIMARTEIDDVVDIVNIGENDVVDRETGEVHPGKTYWSIKPYEEMTNGGVIAIQELKSTKEGMVIKLHDQRAAMKQLAELQGYDAPSKSEITTPKDQPIEIRDMDEVDLKDKLREIGVELD